MSYAVVKFIAEDDGVDVVSKVPISWLNEDQTMCKWPLDKFASLYIAKNIPSQDHWPEHPIVLECICDTFAEAKKRASGGPDKPIGRGFRAIIPPDYFSPAEEEEKARGQRNRELFKKKDIPASDTNHHMTFITLMDSSTQSSMQSIEKPEENNVEKVASLDDTGVTVQKNVPNDGSGVSLLGTGLAPLHNVAATNSFSGSETDKVVLEEIDVMDTPVLTPESASINRDDLNTLNKKLDSLGHFLAQLKLDVLEIKEPI